MSRYWEREVSALTGRQVRPSDAQLVQKSDDRAWATGYGVGLAVVIDHMFNIQHNFSISPMSLCGHLLHTTTPRLEDSGGLRVQHERYRQQSFDPFCELLVGSHQLDPARHLVKPLYQLMVWYQEEGTGTYKLISPMSFESIYSHQSWNLTEAWGGRTFNPISCRHSHHRICFFRYQSLQDASDLI